MRRIVRAVAGLPVVAVLVVGLVGCDASDDGDATALATDDGCEDGGAGPGARSRQLVHDGITRDYTVHLPAGYDGETPAPLVFNLHGFGGDIAGHDATTDLPAQAGERDYIVVTPQAGPLTVPDAAPESEDAAGFEGFAIWNFFGSGAIQFADEVPEGFEGLTGGDLATDDIGFFVVLVDTLLTEYCVDPNRVFSTGMSNGAGMSTVIGCELDGRIRAIGPVAGVNLSGVCSGDEPVSVLAIHGDADPIVEYDGNGLYGFELGNPSVPDRMAQWADHNGCASEPAVDDRGGGVVVTRWEGCDDDAEVELWTLAGWEHEWPRGEAADGPGSIEATTAMLDFFDRVGS